MIILVVYLVFIFPVSSLINYMDLRWTVICTGFWNVMASATQFATLNPDSFPFVMVVSFFAALSNLLSWVFLLPWPLNGFQAKNYPEHAHLECLAIK
ncbi:hypothetical protein TNIN_375911 [Trichonephila inaurata madagascariensis]|uniref:Uncharacterized protein n=1 Tax=Trichonephila inaurata madagascariensis TaxID=2747483 RepID=A0A8X6Y9D9_9ARAC|nr:hypothetical protein TNIN_375911 [Trichonephila inaurata madagascariensis]